MRWVFVVVALVAGFVAAVKFDLFGMPGAAPTVVSNSFNTRWSARIERDPITDDQRFKVTGTANEYGLITMLFIECDSGAINGLVTRGGHGGAGDGAAPVWLRFDDRPAVRREWHYTSGGQHASGQLEVDDLAMLRQSKKMVLRVDVANGAVPDVIFDLSEFNDAVPSYGVECGL